MHNVDDILFLDIEVDKVNKIFLAGAILGPHQWQDKSPSKIFEWAKTAKWVCGHNILAHDLILLKQYEKGNSSLFALKIIDTLLLSPLFFPKERYHKLIKGYQLNVPWLNDPLKDSEQAKTVLLEQENVFDKLIPSKQNWLYYLLHDKEGFDGFFNYKNFIETIPMPLGIAIAIQNYFFDRICHASPLNGFILDNPIALAYALSTIDANPEETGFVAPYVLHKHPTTESILQTLRTSCGGQCESKYCKQQTPHAGLERFFGYTEFRSYDNDPLQEKAVKSALKGESLLVVFPTGGGKSLTFQLPALMQGYAKKALTVVISPLQSLMKDQVDVLEKRHEIVQAVTINGMLSPLERQEAFERVAIGNASLLYISPESLRSRRILELLAQRVIDRFVIDEAHCFSSWGQDFRVDYLYIPEFIRKLEELKGNRYKIPVSCFTATAKPAVIEDICTYFEEKLSIKLALFTSNSSRTNLQYYVIPVEGEEQKQEKLLDLLSSRSCPTIIYVARTKHAELIMEFLRKKGYNAQTFHGKMDRSDKIEVMDAFMDKESGMDIVVATSAFGMGVDKDNVGMVIHYTISDSLENYVQEAGRAGRDPKLIADCYVLFNINDLDQHFQLLNSSRISQEEINQIWRGIKQFKQHNFIRSAKEIAKISGWDLDMYELETRVKSAISALEQAKYIRREENVPCVFADSIAVTNAEQANKLISKEIFNPQIKTEIERIVSYIISRSRDIEMDSVDIDDISDSLQLTRETVMRHVRKLKEIGVLKDDKDLSAYINLSAGKHGALSKLNRKAAIEPLLAELLFRNKKQATLKCFLRELNEEICSKNIDSHSQDIKEIFNYWQIISAIEKERVDAVHDEYKIKLKTDWAEFEAKIDQRIRLAKVILDLLSKQAKPDKKNQKKHIVEFSIQGLKADVEKQFNYKYDSAFYETTLLYLQHCSAIELKDGFIVYYNPMKIVKTQAIANKQYTQQDYEKLGNFYEHKTEQIHIVGEYAKRYLQNKLQALAFVTDYFVLEYPEFLSKYFSREQKNKLKNPITEERLLQLQGDLSEEQLTILHSKSDKILVAAGPGSGKTKLLVHKVASLLLIEEVKPEQFLMLTFSRPAAQVFKSRLLDLVGAIALGVDIHTFHGFSFQLLGRLGNLDRSETIINQATAAINDGSPAIDKILAKTVIVVDEYQDVSQDEYNFLMAIANKIEKLRMIVVGDDDQNIYEFRGSSVKYMRQFKEVEEASLFFLTVNYRSSPNIVALSNRYLTTVMQNVERIKSKELLKAYKTTNGLVECSFYPQSESLYQPLVEDIITKSENETLVGKSTAVLVFSNEEAFMLFALLKDKGLPVRLLAGQDEFQLRQLLELRSFETLINHAADKNDGKIEEDAWLKAKEDIQVRYKGASNLGLAIRIITAFERDNTEKFKSIWRSYLAEIRLADFFSPSKNLILISTMHKAKGKEFDHVWLMVDKQYPIHFEEKKRVLYVALTRAKFGLHIHSGLPIFKTLCEHQADIDYKEDCSNFPVPNKLLLQCSLENVNIGFSYHSSIQLEIRGLLSGSRLIINDLEFYQSPKGKLIGQFSKDFQKRLKEYTQKGYAIKDSTIGYIVSRYDSEKDEGWLIVLPMLTLEGSQ